MAFQKPKKQPTFSDLKAILAQVQKLDEPSYQLFQILIDRLVQFQAVIKEELGSGKPGEDGKPGPTGPQGPPGSSNAIPHQATHRPGGNDILVNNAWTDTVNIFDQRQVISGGASGAYANAPLEIMMTGNPRVSFHWLGVVASQLGMDSAGTIRTFDNPGTGYAPFACGALTANGALTAATGNITTVNATTVNASGTVSASASIRSISGHYLQADGSYGLYMPSSMIQMFSDQYWWTNKANTVHRMGLDASSNLTVTGSVTAVSLSANSVRANGTVRIGNINIQADSAVDPGLPFMRAANAAAHLCINARPIYFNLDFPGHQILHYGPTTFYYPISVPSITNNTGLAHGIYNPTDAGAIANIISNSFYQARWMRVGSVVTVSGQVDVSTNPSGTCHARMYLPTYILQGNALASANGGTGIVNTAFGETGYVNVQASAGHADLIWTAKAAGIHGLFYHFTYSTT